jgi:DNA replication and repair protein RecF
LRDRLVTTLLPGHSAEVADSDKATRQRNRLLDEDADPLWISAVERQMAQHATAIHFARIDCLAHLDALIAAGAEDAAFPRAGLRLTPLLDGELPGMPHDLEDMLRARWADERALDRAAGRTLSGPHRVDFEVAYSQKGVPAALGSTGEQ